MSTSMGNITTAMMLDHEALASHTVIITATDSDDATDDASTVTVNGRGHAPGLPGDRRQRPDE